MSHRGFRTAALVAVFLSLSACSSMQSAGHQYFMRGQVVEVTGSEVVVCVGSKDGAQVGQELTAYKLASRNIGGSGKNPPSWERIAVGSVRIVAVVDEHFARAQVTSGQVDANNLVELNR